MATSFLSPVFLLYSTCTRQSFHQFLRTYPWQHYSLCMAPLCVVMVFLALFIGTGTDLPLYFSGVRSQNPALTKVMLFITNWLNPIFYVVYALIFWKGLKNANAKQIRFAVGYLVLQLLVSFLLVRIIKIGIGRPRPMIALGDAPFTPFSWSNAYHSFPSGHTSEVVGSVLPLVAWCKRWIFSLFMGLIVALVGFSRVYLSMHHLSDLATGMVTGTIAGVLIYYFCMRVKT